MAGTGAVTGAVAGAGAGAGAVTGANAGADAGAAEREALASELPDGIPTCAHDAAGGAMLRDRIIAFFDDQLVTERLAIPYARRSALAELRDHVRVVSEEYGEEITVSVRATPEILARLRTRSAGGS